MCSAKNARLLQNGIEMPFEKRAKVGFKEGGRQNEGRECVPSGHCARAREANVTQIARAKAGADCE